MNIPVKTLIIVGGPSGTGKSTIAMLLSEELHSKYVEGDDYHPEANVKKMEEGIPLTDDDRWGWLTKLSDTAVELFEDYNVVVISCSILKKKYRNFIKERVEMKENNKNIKINIFMFVLMNDYEIIYKRMLHRASHYMKANMLESQFKDLELPKFDESNVYKIECGELTSSEIVDKIFNISLLKQKL